MDRHHPDRRRRHVYQRGTGPTYPYRATIDVGQGEPISVRLLRSAETTGDALIAVPNPGRRLAGTMDWRRYNSTDAWTTVPLTPQPIHDHPGSVELVARLPFPVGHDLTDNKTLAQWIAWLLAAALIWRARATAQPTERLLTRTLVIVAALLMLAVYLVPHSLRGSELDYARLDSLRQQHGQSVDPTRAIGTGR